MSPINRQQMTSYSPFILTMQLSCTIFELQQVICQKSQIFPTPCAAVTPFEFCQDLCQQKNRSLSICVALLVWSYV